jgi:hypothetical protein
MAQDLRNDQPRLDFVVSLHGTRSLPGLTETLLFFAGPPMVKETDMNLRDFVFTIIGGLIVWVFQQFYLNRPEGKREREAKIVKPPTTEKILPEDIF